MRKYKRNTLRHNYHVLQRDLSSKIFFFSIIWHLCFFSSSTNKNSCHKSCIILQIPKFSVLLKQGFFRWYSYIFCLEHLFSQVLQPKLILTPLFLQGTLVFSFLISIFLSIVFFLFSIFQNFSEAVQTINLWKLIVCYTFFYYFVRN